MAGRLKFVGLTREIKMAELDVRERQSGDVTILDLSGSIRMGEGCVSLRNSLRGLADGGKKKILLNLASVKNVDSSGIGELIANYTSLTRDGGQLKLLNLTEKIRDLLVITKLLTVFDAYESEPEALSTFK
jgi:anti-sigma B factor antagonist